MLLLLTLQSGHMRSKWPSIWTGAEPLFFSGKRKPSGLDGMGMSWAAAAAAAARARSTDEYIALGFAGAEASAPVRVW